MSFDTSRDMTISLAKAPTPSGAPKARIVAFVAWIKSPAAPISKAKAGDKINFTVTVCNVGKAKGKLFAYIMDKDTTVVVCPTQRSADVNPGCRDQVSFVWKNLTMPNRDWHLQARAGHIESAPIVTPPGFGRSL